jgi:outer membrane protein assembly factor BamC
MAPSLTALACAMSVLSTGCSTISETLGSDKVDYRSSGNKTVNLEVPPDLVQLSGQGRYTHAAGGVISATAFDKQGQATQNQTPQIAASSQGGVTLEREGQLRWLSTSQTPDQIWTQIRDFWAEQGFELTIDQPKSGLLETNWSENRANLREDGLRKLVGNVLDKLYDTGERDQFRTRVERTSRGSEIYISHRGLAEIYTDGKQEQTTWKSRPADANLETIMLTKLMAKLGATKEATEAAASSTAPREVSLPRARIMPDGISVALENSGDFDQAWRRVNLALDRGGFTVEDRDRSKGVFDVRLVTSNTDQKKSGGMFDAVKGWFGSKPSSDNVVRYRLQLVSQGNTGTVTVQGQDAAGMREVARLLAANLE